MAVTKHYRFAELIEAVDRAIQNQATGGDRLDDKRVLYPKTMSA
jgi:hypothetical protein